ncbi:hypothetical protein H4V97_001286 [Flavobacterium sp. CG_23.5]|jgi:hypothetical protein|nr:hypothetical protein [Flavobacterium sp. CG_23.5]
MQYTVYPSLTFFISKEVIEKGLESPGGVMGFPIRISE